MGFLWGLGGLLRCFIKLPFRNRIIKLLFRNRIIELLFRIRSSQGPQVQGVSPPRVKKPPARQRDDNDSERAPLHRHVKAPPAVPAPPPNELIQISEMDEWMQACFPGYSTLNLLQSKVFPMLFQSDENALVCAPTGCGKTDVAMLSVLREVSKNRVNGAIEKLNFKIVYVAPLKALATEVVDKFSKRLEPLGLVVREHTGDAHLTNKELAETQMIVVTPEKYDSMTRKGGLDNFASHVKLLIFDEVHILNDDRGHVIEALVARTLRQVEASKGKQHTRLLGLSATLPNYEEVAKFMSVKPAGTFNFGSNFRPVPLSIDIYDVFSCSWKMMDNICSEQVEQTLKQGYQVLVFVHSRRGTDQTARVLYELAEKKGTTHLFCNKRHPLLVRAQEQVNQSSDRKLRRLFERGLGIHHAGMDRSDKLLTEKLFADGLIKVLFSTATLAWGVNLPAHTVVIKGTQVYDSEKGGFVDLGVLDIMQMFGRAGRPQFDRFGEAVLITEHGKIDYYLGMLTSQLPIESKLAAMLVDNLNAEIALGTVSSLEDAKSWLKHTYLYTRIQKNPQKYFADVSSLGLKLDPSLEKPIDKLLEASKKKLIEAKMIVSNDKDKLTSTALGTVASHCYIRYQSIVTFSFLLRPSMREADILSMVAQSSEFDSINVRNDQEERNELKRLKDQGCKYEIVRGLEDGHEKVIILIQASVSRIKAESMRGEQVNVEKNATRILKALVKISLMWEKSQVARACLTLCKCLERKMWPDAHRLCQLRGGQARCFPQISMVVSTLHPVTRKTMSIGLVIRSQYEARSELHGEGTRWLILVEDVTGQHAYHHMTWMLTNKMAKEGDQRVEVIVPAEPLPTKCRVRAVSEDWLGAEAVSPLLSLADFHPSP